MLTFRQIEHEMPEAPALSQDQLGFPVVLEYLRKRGIESSELDDLGIRILPSAELMTKARGVPTYDDRLAVVFPHFNVAGDYIDWWSARLVDTGIRSAQVSFASMAPSKRGKMFCPPNEPPHAYLVPTLDWAKLQKGDKVFIHESCIKAINGAKCDTWSIGLNGVWGWSSRKHGVALVDEIKNLPWKALELQPVIVFDSNAADNWDVQNAIAHLAAKLLEVTGRRATHLLLPTGPDGKHWGFDDFCVAHGREYATAWLAGDGAPIEIGGVELLKLQLNNEVCVVRSLSRIAEQETGTLMTKGSFCEVNYAHYTAMVEDGDRERLVVVPKLWLMDPRRTEVEKIDYIPGVTEKVVGKVLNCWKGWGVEALAGDVDPWLALLSRNVEDEALRKWIIQWFAYPIQHPGEKLTSFIHFWGPPGTGKNAVLAPIIRLYGGNAVVCLRDDLASNFNMIIAYKQFINFDELYGGTDKDAVRISNKIKPLVTGETVNIEPKGVDKWTIKNTVNIVTTSNYVDAIRLDDDDRRAAVIRMADQSHKNDKGYWTEYFRWAEHEGAGALFAHLLQVDLSDFDPKGWAPETDDKREMTRATRRVDEQWVNMLVEDPDQVLTPVLRGRALMTGDELAQYCFADDPGGITPSKKNMLGIRLHSAGLKKIELKIDGKKTRFWVIRQTDKEWTSEEARKHLAAQAYPGAKSKP
jgi:hypothetical protein